MRPHQSLVSTNPTPCRVPNHNWWLDPWEYRRIALNAPNLVILELSHQCNLRCLHCCVDENKHTEHGLTTREASGIIDQIVDFKVPFLTIGGGEPLLREDLFEITCRAAKHMDVTLTTNGWLLDRGMAFRAASSGVSSIIVSLDSVDARRHDNLRGMSGSHEKAFNAIMNCLSVGIPCSLCATLTKVNQEDVEGLVKLSQSLGLSVLQFNRFIPVGRGKMNRCALELSEREYQETLELINQMRVETKGSLLIQICHDPQETLAFGPGSERKGGGCIAGRGWAAVGPTGDLFACPFLPIKIGNIFNKPFPDIWAESNFTDRATQHCLASKLANESSTEGKAGSAKTRKPT